MKMEPGVSFRVSLLIDSTKLYILSDQLGIYGNEFQIIGALVAAFGNQLGVLSSQYAVEADKMQLLEAFIEADEERAKGIGNVQGPVGEQLKQMENKLYKQLEFSGRRQEEQIEILRQQMEQLQKHVEYLRQLIENHIENS